MTYSKFTPIAGKGTGSPNEIVEWAERGGAVRTGDLREYLTTIYRIAPALGLNPDVMAAQSHLETAGWKSLWWSSRLNPAGIGITGDAKQNEASRDFGTGETAAMAHLLHLWLYAEGSMVPTGFLPEDDPRWDEAIAAGYAGIADTLHDLNRRWAIDKQDDYGGKIAGRMNEMVAAGLIESDAPSEESMADHQVTWPGLPGGAITFSFPVHLNIVPAWRTQQRPGIKARSVRRSIQHENGNPAAGAKADSTYLFNGAGGRQASWHASVDHLEGYINLPADEVGWQAGDGSGPGNMNGFAVELCQRSWSIGGTSWRLARKNAAEIMGRVSARIKASPPHEQHNYYSSYGKNCPEKLRGNATWWAEYKADWQRFYNDEIARMAGGGTPAPSVPKYGINDVLATTVNLNLRRTPGTSSAPLKTLTADTAMLVTGRSETAEGFTWIPVLIDQTLAGYVAESGTDGTVYIKMVTDNPDPVEYAKPSPIPALLDTDVQKEENVTAIETDDTGNEFTYVRDVIEFTRETKAGQYASEESLPVHEPFKAGERALAAWICRNTKGEHYYVLTGGVDEWVRVPVANTKWIADAPLQGDDEVPDEPPA